MKVMQDNPDGVNAANVVVGIAACGERTFLAEAVEQVDRELSAHYSGRSMALVCCDTNSNEALQRDFMQIHTKSPKIYLTGANGDTGKGSHLMLLLEIAIELSSAAVVVISPERSLSMRHLVRNLCEPLFQNYHFVAPLYLHRKYSGPFTSHLAYPLLRALYGRRVRQPLGEEFGFSGRMAHILHEAELRQPSGSGTRVWMTTTAMRSKVALIQSFLGPPGEDASATFSEASEDELKGVLQAMFELMCRHQEFWKQVKWSKPTALFGVGPSSGDSPPPVNLDAQQLQEQVSRRLHKHWDLCKAILEGQNLSDLDRFVADFSADKGFPPELWALIVYDVAVAFKRAFVPRDDLLDVLLTLYYAKTLWFVMETRAMTTEQVEVSIENQCLVFEQTKPYLLQRWFDH